MVRALNLTVLISSKVKFISNCITMIQNIIFRQINKSSFYSIVKFLSLLIGFTILIVVMNGLIKNPVTTIFGRIKTASTG